MSDVVTIAIDGPAASGKGTLARRLAAHFGLPYLDTGLLYRAVGRGVLDAGGDPADPHAAAAAALALRPDTKMMSMERGISAAPISAGPRPTRRRRMSPGCRRCAPRCSSSSAISPAAPARCSTGATSAR